MKMCLKFLLLFFFVFEGDLFATEEFKLEELDSEHSYSPRTTEIKSYKDILTLGFSPASVDNLLSPQFPEYRIKPPVSLLGQEEKKTQEHRSFNILECQIVRIAIVGGGGMGCTLAALLSNISDSYEQYGIQFHITIFERNESIINGSSFETATVIHAGGNEYEKDSKTSKWCIEAGKIHKKVFSKALDHENSIIFSMPYHISEERAELYKYDDSIDDNIEKLVQSNIKHRFRTNKDVPVNNIKTNKKLKKFIASKNLISVINNALVTCFTKTPSGYKIKFINDGCEKEFYDPFDFCILSSWDQVNMIDLLSEIFDSTDNELSELDQKFSNYIPLHSEERELALVSIDQLPKEYKIAQVCRPDGCGIIPIGNDLAICVSCVAGATYCKNCKDNISNKSEIEHGNNILSDVKKYLIPSQYNDRIAHLGSIKRIIVRGKEPDDSDKSPREYNVPKKNDYGAISAIPFKATYISCMALDCIEIILKDMMFIDEWVPIKLLENIHSFKNSEELKNTDLFSIDFEPVTDREINEETLCLLDQAELTDEGRNKREQIEKKVKNSKKFDSGDFQSFKRNLYNSAILSRDSFFNKSSNDAQKCLIGPSNYKRYVRIDNTLDAQLLNCKYDERWLDRYLIESINKSINSIMKNTADNMPDIKNFLWGVAISMTIKNKGYDGYASDIRKFNQKIIFSTSNYELLLSENNEQIIYFSKRHNAVLSLEELDAAYQKWRKPLTLVQKISNPIKRVLSGFICQSPDCNDRNRSDVHSLTSLKSRSDDTYASSSPSWRSSKSLKSPLGSVHTVRTVFRARTDFLNSEPDEEYEKTARPKVQNVKNNLKTLAMIAKSRPFENRVAPSGN